jgi:hypothetical protein
MYTVWHVDKYKITFKLVIDHWPRARYRAAARRLRNTVLKDIRCCLSPGVLPDEWTVCHITGHSPGLSHVYLHNFSLFIFNIIFSLFILLICKR